MAEDSSPIDFGDLATEPEFKSSVTNFHNSVDKVGDLLQMCCERDVYSKLSIEDRVQYDLFITYSLNSLFWSYLRTQGIDPTEHSVKGELDRVKSYMARAKQVRDRQSMPRVDKDVAERFVLSGLWEPGQPKLQVNSSDRGTNKRKKFDSESD